MTEENESVQNVRGQWGSRLGFILAAAGGAIGLGNIWRFPYVTGERGGAFVLIYLACIVLVGFPIMIAEIIIGRSTQKSPIGAFEALKGKDTGWKLPGWMSVVGGFIILSYYSVVAGWTLNYFLMSITHFFKDKTDPQIRATFDVFLQSGDMQIFWHCLFMLCTIGIVYSGVKGGIERWSKLLMPCLFMMLLGLVVYCAIFLPRGFSKSVKFLFQFKGELKPEIALEALGQAFFTLSLGMGAMLTYGSYLKKDSDIPKASLWICAADTGIALIACFVIFPIIFACGHSPAQGPGLVFKTMPVLFSQIKLGLLVSMVFFLLLSFAALTSAVSLLEVVAAYFIDERNWSRKKATWISGMAIFLFGIPCAAPKLIFGNWQKVFGKDYFGTMEYLATNWLLPLGGLLIAVFVGWVMDKEKREQGFKNGTSLSYLYHIWLFMLRYIVPILVLLVLLNKVGLLEKNVLKKAEDQFKNAKGKIVTPYILKGEEKPYTGIIYTTYPNDHLKIRYEVKDGIKHGTMTQWYENGKKKLESHWKDGKLDGDYREWHLDESPKAEIFYKNSKKEGKAKFWDEKRVLKEVIYKNDVEQK